MSGKTVAYYRIEPVYQEDLDSAFIKPSAVGTDLVTGEVVDANCSGGSDYLSIATYDQLKQSNMKQFGTEKQT